MKAKCLDYTINETSLGKSERAIGAFFHVNTKKASSRVFLSNPNPIFFELRNQIINGSIRPGVDEEIIDVDNYDDVRTNKETGVEGGLMKPMLDEVF